jgi:hypothetical protein
MLPGGLEPRYRDALAAPHTVTNRVEVWSGGVLVEPDLAFASGQVSATLSNRVTRQCSLTVSEDLFPAADTDLLNPYGPRIKCFRGIEYGDGYPFEWQVFHGRINTVTFQDDGTATLDALDLAADVQDAGFVVPENSQLGRNVMTEFRRLVSEGVPDAVFGDSDGYLNAMPQLTWDSDRAAGLDDIATAVESFWYCLPDGSFVMRRVPWTLAQNPIVTLSDTDVIASAKISLSQETVVNSVSVVGERADGTPPAYGLSQDTETGSITAIDGPFGRHHRTISLQNVLTNAQAQDAARTYRKRMTARTQAWSIRMVPDPALELGDVVTLVRAGFSSVQVVASFSIPLHAEGDDMSVTFRALTPSNPTTQVVL